MANGSRLTNHRDDLISSRWNFRLSFIPTFML